MIRLAQSALFILLAGSPCLATAAGGAAATASPSAKDKCPVCGMFVAKSPNWVATSRLRDGTTYFFDGPKDMFSHYFNTQRYTPGKRQADIIAMQVKEYYSLKTIDANSAFYVIGSDVFGPMGSELIPFASQRDAASFMNDHKGKRIFRFKEINPAIMKTLQ